MTYLHLIIPPIVLIVAIFFLVKFIAQKRREKKKDLSNTFVNRDIFKKKKGDRDFSETDNHLIIRIADTFEKTISNIFSRFFKKIGIFGNFILEKYVQYRKNKKNGTKREKWQEKL